MQDTQNNDESQTERLPSEVFGVSETAIDAYYDAERKEYLYCNKRGVWRSYSEGQFKKRLKQEGFSTGIPKDESGKPLKALSDADEVLLHLQDHRDIDYHGRLCGRKAGFYDENGLRFLVTDGPNLIEPMLGKWPTIKAVITGLLRDSEQTHGDAQWHTLLGWIQTSVKALREESIQQAQALAIAGPTNCGKSLLQQFITHLLGGRAAKAAHFMNGRTDFNGELFEAEHLMLEDEFMSTRIGDRLKLGAAIKNLTVSTQTASCHRKHRHPVNLPAWWRVTITLNDDPEALLVLPPLDDHIEDKIIILRASRFDLPMSTKTTEERCRFWDALISEIPAFLHWLLNHYELPESYRDPKRYVVQTWHHPEMRKALEQLSPESELLDLVDRVVFDSGTEEWRGTASELLEELCSDARTRWEAERLLGSWPRACSTYLSRLEKKPDARVGRVRTNEKREWILRASSSENEIRETFNPSVTTSLPHAS